MHTHIISAYVYNSLLYVTCVYKYVPIDVQFLCLCKYRCAPWILWEDMGAAQETNQHL